MSKGDQAAAITGGEGSLLPIVVFGNVTPDEIMSQFPAAEGDCLKEHLSADRMAEILQTASPTILEGIVIAGCLETITFVRLFVGGFLPESGTFSDSTNACLLERMADTELVRTAGLYMMISMGNIEDPSSAFEILPFLFCLNDEERADADLDLDAVECVVNELGPEALQALSNLGEDDSPPPPTLIAAMTKCGFTEPPKGPFLEGVPGPPGPKCHFGRLPEHPERLPPTEESKATRGVSKDQGLSSSREPVFINGAAPSGDWGGSHWR